MKDETRGDKVTHIEDEDQVKLSSKTNSYDQNKQKEDGLIQGKAKQATQNEKSDVKETSSDSEKKEIFPSSQTLADRVKGRKRMRNDDSQSYSEEEELKEVVIPIAKSSLKTQPKKRDVKKLRKRPVKENPQVSSSVRRRTKLKSSGESSSAEPMDLSKRRDVVNKTILRVVRRFFASEFKATLDCKYGNILETQNR